jgi:hypothetical protein
MQVHEAVPQLPAFLVTITEIVIVLAGIAGRVVAEVFRLKAIRLCLDQPVQRRVDLRLHRGACHLSASAREQDGDAATCS